MLSLALATSATVGKSTYAMSHPFAYKAFMEKVRICLGPSRTFH